MILNCGHGNRAPGMNAVPANRIARLCSLLCLAVILTMAGKTAAATLYGSTSAGGPGELYTLNPANGAVITDVGLLQNLTGKPYALTALRFNITTGVLYGSTDNASPADPACRQFFDKTVHLSPRSPGVRPPTKRTRRRQRAR